MISALAAAAPVPVTPTAIVTTLSPPAVCGLTYEHARALVSDVIMVPDADAAQGTRDMADHAMVWTKPAAGCLLSAAHRLPHRLDPGVRLGLRLCGANATTDIDHFIGLG